MPNIPPYDAVTLRKLAVAASCDPRTVLRYLTGKRLYGTTHARLSQAVAEAGIVVETVKENDK